MAAWHRTLVATEERTPYSWVQTYLVQSSSAVLSNELIQFTPSVRGVNVDQAGEIEVEDFPGGVRARFLLDGVVVITEIMPLFRGRDTDLCEGAALYRVMTDPSSPVALSLGRPAEAYMGVPTEIRKDALTSLEAVKVDEDRAEFRSGREGIAAGIRASSNLDRVPWEGGEALSVTFDHGVGEVLFVYAWEGFKRVKELLGLDAREASRQVHEYYNELLSQRVDTPEDDINKAWRSALYNLEYNWNRPYGWNECIHHWFAMWHNQHTAAAEWIGQVDRSLECTFTLAENLLPSGAVPHFTMDGSRRRDFGGSNHIWAWQVRHAWHFTGDKTFAALVAPALDRVLAQTLEEHDPDQNLLVAWGLQIGNQEDFIQFYNDASTPSIELMNMMRTRAELAQGLDDDPTAMLWYERARTVRHRLLEKLWLRDLGRLGHYIDEHDKIRLDAPYHTYLYPVLWDVVEERDGYTSLRHVRDVLTGAEGEVYCSNNFPNHNNGTWGMQAGAAQQPWAAWAYSKAGWNDLAYQPLLSISNHVMNENLRGAWPEVMREPVPAYFSPPAGLFVASVVEGLFGLRVYRPAGVLEVAPCFPNHWPEASLKLSQFAADYRLEGNKRTYVVESQDPLVREIRWSIPPSRDIQLRIDGVEAKFMVNPGVQRLVVCASTSAAKTSLIELIYEPIEATLIHDGSIAEGDVLRVTGQNVRMLSVDDRCGVLAEIRFDQDALDVRVASGLLAPYRGYGRLGQITFSRRTFFVECIAESTRFWIPVDLTVLPRYEATAKSEIMREGDVLKVSILIRNNTADRLSGLASLHVARQDHGFGIDVAAREEGVVDVRIPPDRAALLSVGDNHASLALPTGETVDLVLTASSLYEDPFLRDYMMDRLTTLSLPLEDLSQGRDWRDLREGSHAGPVPWPGWVDPMEGIEEQATLQIPDLPCIRFQVTPNRWILVGERVGKPYCRIEPPSGYYKKFYLLVAVFADNHDMFTQLGWVTVRGPRQVLLARALHMPGDLDWWERRGMAGTMDTARYGRPDRLGLLPLLKAKHAHWQEGCAPDLPARPGDLFGPFDILPEWKPPSFPQPEYWAECRVLRTDNCNFNVIEVDLGKPMQVDSLSLQAVGICPGFGLYAVVAETTGGMKYLEGTPWMPALAFREPRMVFHLRGPEDLEGWILEGANYGPAIGVPSLNTLILGGETAQAWALSPNFVLGPNESTLVIEMHGGHNRRRNGEDTLVIRLLDAANDEVLGQIEPPGTHILTVSTLDVRPFQGRTVRLELLDGNTDLSYAWIGLREVSLLSDKP